MKCYSINRISRKEFSTIENKLNADESTVVVKIDGRDIKNWKDYDGIMEKKFGFPFNDAKELCFPFNISCGGVKGYDSYCDWITDLGWLSKEGIMNFILIITNYTYDFLAYDQKSKQILYNMFIENEKNWDSEWIDPNTGTKMLRTFTVYLVDNIIEIEDLYDLLKKHDSENRLTLNDKKDEIKLRVDDKYTINAWDDYLEVMLNGKQISHYHPNYDDMYQYILDVMEKKESFPTERQLEVEAKKIQKAPFYFVMWIFIFCAIAITLAAIFNSQNLNLGFRILLVTISIIITVVLNILSKKIKNHLKKK